MASGHDDLVSRQFGQGAAKYVESTVHAQGADLDRLADLAAKLKPSRALDLGCGGGHVSYRLAPIAGTVVALDMTAEMLAAVAAEAARRSLANITTSLGTAERLPFPEASFDLVASRFSVHHWHDFPAGLAEARRVLRPDGSAVFIDTAAPRRVLADSFLQSVELLRDPSHVRDYSSAEWVGALTRAGFEPQGLWTSRLRLDFASWIGRMATPEPLVQAIRTLQSLASDEVRTHFAIEADGSFTIDVLMILARAAD